MALNPGGRPGVFPGMANTASPAQTSQEARLEAELSQLRKRYKRRGFWNRLSLVTGLFFLGAAPLLYLLGANSWIFVLASALYGVIFLTLPILRPLGPLDSSIRVIESEVDLLESRDASEEERAEKFFKVHQIEIKKYYDQTLSHSAWIFWFGILCILAGFGIIVASLVLLVTRTGLGLPGQVIVAVLGAVSGILANFIAVIYLKMHSETIKSLTEFHNRLVATHHLHFGNLLAAKLKNPDLREETLSEMALKLIK
jgi:hypothetical protein